MTNAPRRRTGLWTVLRYLPRYRGVVASGLACLVAGQLLSAYAPQQLKAALEALDRSAKAFVEATANERALRAAGTYVAIVFVQGVLSYLMRRRLVGFSRS